MNRRWAAGLVAVLVAAGLGACGDDDDGGETDAGGRPLLPVGSSAGGATSESAMAADAAADDGSARSMIAPAQRREYRVGAGVDAPATEAAAYRLVPETITAADVQQAIGDDGGTVDLQFGRWTFHREATVSDGDAAVSSPSAGAATDGAATSSADAERDAVARDAGVSSSAPVCAPDETCTYEPPPPPPGVPSAAEAEARFTEILEDLDLDPGAGTFDTYDAADAGPVYQRTVTFRPTVGGRRVIGLEHGIAFGENGRVEWANGFTGTFEKLGAYPLVGLQDALDRQGEMDAGRTATATGAAEPAIDAPAVAEDAGPASDGGGASGSTGGAGQTEPGAPGVDPPMTIEPDPGTPAEPIEPEIVEVTGAELVLLAIWPRCEGDDLVVVPAFELSVGDEVHLTVVAIEETSMAQPDPDAPYEPCPGEEPMDEPVGRPEPAPMPPDAGGREPANP